VEEATLGWSGRRRIREMARFARHEIFILMIFGMVMSPKTRLKNACSSSLEIHSLEQDAERSMAVVSSIDSIEQYGYE
jgi:hypothetical protein